MMISTLFTIFGSVILAAVLVAVVFWSVESFKGL